MSKALIDKLLRARESGVTVGERTYTIRRPTIADVAVMKFGDPSDYGKNVEIDLDLIKRFVVGWDCIESDFDPGGGPEKVAFDAELWAKHVPDHPELWAPLGSAIKDAYLKRVADLEAARKN